MSIFNAGRFLLNRFTEDPDGVQLHRRVRVGAEEPQEEEVTKAHDFRFFVGITRPHIPEERGKTRILPFAELEPHILPGSIREGYKSYEVADEHGTHEVSLSKVFVDKRDGMAYRLYEKPNRFNPDKHPLITYRPEVFEWAGKVYRYIEDDLERERTYGGYLVGGFGGYRHDENMMVVEYKDFDGKVVDRKVVKCDEKQPSMFMEEGVCYVYNEATHSYQADRAKTDRILAIADRMEQRDIQRNQMVAEKPIEITTSPDEIVIADEDDTLGPRFNDGLVAEGSIIELTD